MTLGILLVDDEQESLDTLKPIFKTQFRVVTAAVTDPTADALRLWEADEGLSSAITARSLPDSPPPAGPTHSGYDLIARLKRLRPRARVVARSGHEEHENLAEAVRRGADGFIGKDWSRDLVLGNA